MIPSGRIDFHEQYNYTTTGMAKHPPDSIAHARRVVLLAAFHAALACQAYASVCAPISRSELLVVDRFDLETAGLHSAGLYAVGDAEQAYRARLWHRPKSGDAHAMRFAHEYRAYEIDTSMDRALQTNGHLHRLALSYEVARPHWQLSVAPVLAGSSNAGRHPRVIDGEFIFWQGFMRYRRAWTPWVDAFWGICRDDRFGTTRLKPVLGIDWRVNDKLEMTLGFPDARITWRVHPRWRLQADIHPAGGRWRVYDDALVSRSLFAMESWRLRISLALRITRAHELVIGGGREMRREFTFRLIDGTDIRTAASDAVFTGIRWRWSR